MAYDQPALVGACEPRAGEFSGAGAGGALANLGRSRRALRSKLLTGFLVRVQVEVSLGCSVPPTSAGPGSHVTFESLSRLTVGDRRSDMIKMGPSGLESMAIQRATDEADAANRQIG